MVDMAQREGATKRLEGGAEEGGRVGGGTQRWGRRWEQRRLGSRWRGLGLSLHEWWRGLVEPVADLSILYSTAGPPERFDCRQGGVRRDWADVDLKLVTHGFESSASSPFIQGIKDEWLAAARREGGREVRVLVLDWEVEAEGLLHYDRASTKAVAVGRALGACLAHLVMVHGLAPGRVHLVGHSLGGHLVGVAGREVEWLTGARLARVTGLAPAGPHWVGPKYSHTFPGVERLSRESAEVVDVIHTNGESSGALTSLHWGALQPLGHVDFYPDGGRNQRSCRFRMWDLLHPKAYAKCSHSLAQQYFMQSIRCPHRFRSQVRGVKIQSLTSYFFCRNVKALKSALGAR